MTSDQIKFTTRFIEKQIIKKIINKEYESVLPSERELAKEFSVTRQKIREVLQRLSQDGWIQIQHGKPTRVQFIFEEGGINILNSIIKNNILEFPGISTKDLLLQLLQVRYALAPVYTEMCLKKHSQIVLNYLEDGLTNKLESFKIPNEITVFDWHLHRILCKYSENIIFLFLLNSFQNIYFYFGIQYFSLEESRNRSIKFYNSFYSYIKKNHIQKAIDEIKKVTQDSIYLLEKALNNSTKK